jgi:hypothetical protein
MAKTLTLPHHLNADRFGCEAAFFTEHVKGKELEIVDFLKPIYVLKIAGKHYTLHERDLKERYDGLPDFITDAKEERST